jgi:hypothetical protein
MPQRSLIMQKRASAGWVARLGPRAEVRAGRDVRPGAAPPAMVLLRPAGCPGMIAG